MSISLRKLLKREYLRSILLPLILIELMLLVAYFWSNTYVSDATQKALVEETKANIAQISRRAAENIDSEFTHIAALTTMFAREHERFFNTFDPTKIDISGATHYDQVEDGAISNHKDDPKRCTLFYSNIAATLPYRMEKAFATQALDPFYNMILESNQNIAQLYFNSHDSMNRLCPYMHDALAQYPHDIDIPVYNFYYLADAAHNPQRRTVWTEAYLDPAGQGWMISAIAPVYRGDFLEGVVGIDVTIEKLIANILSIELPYLSSAMLVDHEGNILAMSSALEEWLGIRELKSHDYAAPVTQTIAKPKDFNLFAQEENPFAAHLAQMVASETTIETYDAPTLRLLLMQHSIPQTNWRLLVMVDKDDLLFASEALKSQTYLIGFIAMGLMALFYVLFLGWIIRRSRHFAATILKPIEALIDATGIMASNLETMQIARSNIREMDLLLEHFERMSERLRALYDTLDERIQEGVRENARQQEMLIGQSRLAALGEMIGMIGHQWRQPLNTLALLVQNLDLEAQLGEVGQTQIATMSHAAMEQIRFMSKTIDDFRNFYRSDRTKRRFDLRQAVEQSLSLVRPALIQNRIALAIASASEAPMELEGYESEFQQVMLNLISNAQDAIIQHPKKERWIRIGIKQQDATYEIEVEDSGGGIDELIIEKIFDPYFTTKGKVQGTGLGLYMSKMIVERNMNGTLQVRNGTHGALFVLILPTASV